MKRLVVAGMMAAAAVAATPAQPQAIERACLSSTRQAATRDLCGCIQEVANLTLTPGDQRLAASFFGKPQRAQDVRQSPGRAREQFWERYKVFGEAAQDLCS